MKKMMMFLMMLLNTVNVFAQDARLVLPVGHTNAVNSAAFSPDGKYVLTASMDHTAKIWDAITGKLLHSLEGHTSRVNSAQYSPDGKYVVTGSDNYTAKIWDATSGKLLHSLEGHTSPVYSAHYSPDGKYVITGSDDHTAKIWDAKSGKLLHSLEGHTGVVYSAQYSPDGKYVITGSWDHTSKIWDATSGKLLHSLEGHTGYITSTQYSPDGKYVITGSRDTTAKIWDAASGKLLHSLEGHTDYVSSAQFSPDGKYVITASSDTTAKIWNAVSGKLLHSLEGHTDAVNSAQYSPDGKYVITGSSDKTEKIWDAISGKLLHSLEGHTNAVYSAQNSPDGKYVITGSDDQTSKIWDASSGKLLHSLEGYTSWVNSAQNSPDGKYVITGSDDQTSKIWDAISGKLLHSLEGHTDAVCSAQYSPDGKYVITGSWDQTSKIWDAISGKLLHSLEGHTDAVNSAQYSPDGKYVITGSWDQTSKIWDAASGKLLHSLEGHKDYVSSAQYSPDGKYVITGSWDKTSKIWDAASGKLLHSLEGHTDAVNSAQYSTDGKYVITGSWDKTSKIWDAASGKLLHSLEGHTNAVSAQYSPDGTYIISVSDDGTVKIWDATTGKLLHSLEGHTSPLEVTNFSPDGKYIISGSWDGALKTWDANSGKLLHSLGHKSPIRSANFSPDGKYIISGAADGTLKKWEAISGKLLYTYLQLRGADWLAYDEHYRYDGSTGARDLLYFVCGLEIVDLSQVKDALYVPNLVQRIMNGENLDHLPKLKDLEICGVTPEIEPNDNKKDGGNYYQIKARKGGVGKVEIYINGMLRQTVDSKTLAQKDGVYELKIDEKLIQQYQIADKETELKVIARTADNKISSRGAVARTTAKETVYRKPSLHAIMVGIDDYKGEGLDLNYAAKDAIDLQTALKISTQKLFNVDDTNRVHFYNLTLDRGGNIKGLTPDRNNILKTLEKIEKESKPEDVFVLFFAGHGEINPEKQLILLTAEASKEQAPNYSGILMKELLEKLARIPAGKRILLLDACHSGAAINELNIKDIAGVRDGEDAEKQSQRLKELENLASKSGLAIITASSTDQKALELPQYEHGLMTYALLTTMLNDPEVLDKDNNLQLEDWLRQTEKNVSKLIENQSAQRFVPINFSLGKVDEEVRKSIVLQEIPTIVVGNVYNKELDDDNLDIKTQLIKKLNEISTRGGTDKILIAEKDGPNAISVNLSYELIEGKIKSKITLKKDKKVFKQFNFEGNATDLNKIVEELSKEITKNLK